MFSQSLAIDSVCNFFYAITVEILFRRGLVDLAKALQVGIPAGCVGYRIVAS
jgi:hypothetical protein